MNPPNPLCQSKECELNVARQITREIAFAGDGLGKVV